MQHLSRGSREKATNNIKNAEKIPDLKKTTLAIVHARVVFLILGLPPLFQRPAVPKYQEVLSTLYSIVALLPLRLLTRACAMHLLLVRDRAVGEDSVSHYLGSLPSRHCVIGPEVWAVLVVTRLRLSGLRVRTATRIAADVAP